MLHPMKTVLVATLALATLALSGCIIVIEQAPSEKVAAAKKAAAAKPATDSSSK
jgi:hypothetical protein